MRRTLVLFVRVPVLGRGKRRLAREIGDVLAVRFERQMLALLPRRLARCRRWRLRIAATPDRARRCGPRRPARIERVGQGVGDLGTRMSRAIGACPPGPVVLVGSDIPAMRASHIAAAFGLLGARDLVFGPAEDGGFWLVGTRRRQHLALEPQRRDVADLARQAALAAPECRGTHEQNQSATHQR